jgi:hypothetical protein
MSAKPASQWQFTLWRALVVIASLNVLFGAIAWAGLLGAVLCGVGVGLISLCLGSSRADARYWVFGLLMTLACGVTLLAGGFVTIGDGRSSQPCTILVVERTSRQPVAGAAVSMREVRQYQWPEYVPSQPIPADEYGGRGSTDNSGTAIVTTEFPYSDKRGLFVNDAHIYISPDFWIQVDASGFQRKLVRLESLVGSSYNYFKLPLPRVTIELERSESIAHSSDRH